MLTELQLRRRRFFIPGNIGPVMWAFLAKNAEYPSFSDLAKALKVSRQRIYRIKRDAIELGLFDGHNPTKTGLEAIDIGKTLYGGTRK